MNTLSFISTEQYKTI